jgi:hypothetical protein
MEWKRCDTSPKFVGLDKTQSVAFWLSEQHHGGRQKQAPYKRWQKGSQEESG